MIWDPNAGLSATMVSVKLPFIVVPLRVVFQFDSVSVALCRCAWPVRVKLPPALTVPEAGMKNDATSTDPCTSVPLWVSVSRSAPDWGV